MPSELRDVGETVLAKTLKQLKSFPKGKASRRERLRCVCFSPDGQWAVTGGSMLVLQHLHGVQGYR